MELELEKTRQPVSLKVSDLMRGKTPDEHFTGWTTNDDWVLAIDITEEAESEKDYLVVQMGVAGLDAQLNPITSDKQYIRAGNSTTKTGTQRTFVVTGDRYFGDSVQDFIFSNKIKYGTGDAVVVPYVYFNTLTGKGEKGQVSIIVDSDGSGNAGESSGFSVNFNKIGQLPEDYKYSAI